MIDSKTLLLFATTVALACCIIRTSAQEVTIPDPGLDAAIRTALQKPTGPLTETDLLGLINLSAGGKNIRSVEGLEAARNLSILDLDNNSITNFVIANVLTNLTILDLFNNQLTNFSLPNPLPKLSILDLAFNSLSECSLPDGLSNLDTLFLEDNALTQFSLPANLTNLTQLDLSANALTSFTLPPEVTNLVGFACFANPQLTNLTLPPNLTRLGGLDLDFDQLSSLDLPPGLTHLASLVARDNQLTNLAIPADMTNLAAIDLGGNQLANLTLPPNLNRLSFLRLSENKLTNLTLPEGMTNLSAIFLQQNQLTNLVLPSGLSHLIQLDLCTNQLTSLTLPSDMTNLTTLLLDGNPLATLILSEPLATSTLAVTIATLQNQGVQVFTYPLAVRLTLEEQQRPGTFEFGITGPPGIYSIFSSSNLADWTALNFAGNPLGTVAFTDPEAALAPRKFYRALLMTPPTNMVFIAPNVFTLGSALDEVGHQANEGPPTDVSLTHGFWMAKYLVTQREYLAVTGENPSQFPGDLDRPVETVSWFAASNYCALLTTHDQAAGRIPSGTEYRLPTEAEWECAARAGTTTRFNYGDDANMVSLSNYAWYSANSGLMTQPVGQKLANAWGLYDMSGNVWEWCQDWLGDYPGGNVTDPKGPPTNPIGWKVIRGGAWEASALDCRSARRGFEPASPFISDFIIGFRVVLATKP